MDADVDEDVDVEVTVEVITDVVTEDTGVSDRERLELGGAGVGEEKDEDPVVASDILLLLSLIDN